MRKEQINDKEAICTLIIFIVGSTLILGIGGSDVTNDKWIAGILGYLMSFPMLLIYARIQTIFAGQDIFDILILLLGKLGGRIVSVIFVFYSFHLGALVTRNFGEFINIVTLPETPMIILMLAIALISIIAVRLGIEVIGRTCAYILPIVLVIVIAVQLLGLHDMRLNFIKPILSSDMSSLMKSGFKSFSFPFAEAVIFLGVLFCLKNKKSTYKVLFTGTSFAGILIITITIRNILIVGRLASSLYFPSHEAVSRISIGEFLQRFEVSVAFVFAMGTFIKITVCLFVSTKGIARIFNLHDYRSVVIQTGIFMVLFAQILYKNTMEMSEWAFEVYPYYAFPFQVILPVGVWILAEIKKNKLVARAN